MSGTWKPIVDIANDVRSGQVKALDLVEHALKTIDENKEYDAIIAKTDKRARQRALAIDDAVKKGQKLGRLAGVPFIAKDNFLVFGAQTTAGSNMLRGFNAPYQATAIERLEAEGAICVAKANLDAYGHGSSTENSDFFTTKNPYDKTRVPGGSSGGSAVAVALQMAPFAVGTDTGSSVRLPAAFCGVVGLKPTYGSVSRSGVVAMASSLDVIGPLARNVDDAALVFDVMAGKDELDSTTIDRDKDGYVIPKGIVTDLKHKKVAILKEYMDETLDQEVRDTIMKAVNQLKAAGATVGEVSIPSMPLSLAVYYILSPAEISSNLSRYDGQRYPYSYDGAKDLEESYTLSRSKGFGKEAKRRIMIGTHVLSSGYYDAYYRKAQTVRTKLINEINKAFTEHDFLIGPVSPTLPFKIGEKTDDPLKMYSADLLVTAANLTGICAVSIPAGLSRDGLPVGLQIMGKQRDDRELLLFAKQAERIIG